MNGGIAIRDPAVNVSDIESWALLWEFCPGWSLQAAEKVADFLVAPPPDSETVRLQLVSSSHPALQSAVGRTIDLNPSHGWLIRRMSWSDNGQNIAVEARDFFEASPGVWLPRLIEGSLDGKPLNRTRVADFKINERIPENQLRVQFPTGAKVRTPDGKIHLWGKDKPSHTFENTEQLQAFLYIQAREQQTPVRTPLTPNDDTSGPSLLLILNLVLIGALVVLFLVRRFLSRSGHASK